MSLLEKISSNISSLPGPWLLDSTTFTVKSLLFQMLYYVMAPLRTSP